MKRGQVAAPRPEEVVEASLRLVPARGAVLEILTESPAALCRRLSGVQVELTVAELEAQLSEAGLELHGRSRSRSAVPLLTRIATDVAKALAKGRPVLVVRTAPGPRLVSTAGGLSLGAAREAGIGAAGRALNVGPTGRVAELVAAGLVGWLRAQRRRPERVLLVTGGGEDPDPGEDWQPNLRRLASALDLELGVRHLPPGVARWTRPIGPVFAVDTIAPGGRTFRTEVGRLYPRRPARWPAPVTVDVRELAAGGVGAAGIEAEGTPARRVYRVRPAGRRG